MKVSFVTHASIILDSNGTRILSDPWWQEPCFGVQWWTFPDPRLDLVEEAPIDYIYVSHGHHDHFHPVTLARLDRRSKLLVSSELDLTAPLRRLGFQVIEVAPDSELELECGSKIRIMPTHGGDTLFAIDDGKEVCLNLNDALHSAPRETQDKFVELLRQLYPRIDYVFCGYGTASHFPNCYVIPGKDQEKTAIKRQVHFNRQWARLIHQLKPRYAFPFAADVVFYEKDLFWLNAAIHNGERATETFRKLYDDANIEVLDIAPGFEVRDGNITVPKTRKMFDAEEIRSRKTRDIARANNYGKVSFAGANAIAELLRENIDVAAPYLLEYSGNYRMLIDFRQPDFGIGIEKSGDSIDVNVVSGDEYRTYAYDLKCTTRLPYLKRSLQQEYGWEILLVGSGVLFEYPTRDAAKSNLHLELRTIICRNENCPTSRYGRSSPNVFRIKSLIKRLLGMQKTNLYDLNSWTVFK